MVILYIVLYIVLTSSLLQQEAQQLSFLCFYFAHRKLKITTDLYFTMNIFYCQGSGRPSAVRQIREIITMRARFDERGHWETAPRQEIVKQIQLEFDTSSLMSLPCRQRASNLTPIRTLFISLIGSFQNPRQGALKLFSSLVVEKEGGVFLSFVTPTIRHNITITSSCYGDVLCYSTASSWLMNV